MKAELEELKEDLETFGELYKQREEKGEITPYVYRENMNTNEVPKARYELLVKVNTRLALIASVAISNNIFLIL